jgi:hypothetical protein
MTCSTRHESGIGLHVEARTLVSWCVRMRHTQYRWCDAQSSVTLYAQVVSNELFCYSNTSAMTSTSTAEVSNEDEVVMNMLPHHSVNSCSKLPRME